MEDRKLEEIIEKLVLLEEKDLDELTDRLDNYIKIKHKSKKDNILLRYVALRGYKTLTDFYNKQNITKDNLIASTIRKDSDSLKAYRQLKQILNISNEIYLQILEQGDDKK